MENDPSKPYKLTFEHHPDYLYAYITGEHDNYQISRRYWQEISDECGRIGCTKLLIEEDIPVIVSMTEMYQIASEIPYMGFSGVRIAFVDRYIEQNDLNEFGEMVATNRGVFGKIFNDAEIARTWLFSE